MVVCSLLLEPYTATDRRRAGDKALLGAEQRLGDLCW